MDDEPLPLTQQSQTQTFTQTQTQTQPESLVAGTAQHQQQHAHLYQDNEEGEGELAAADVAVRRRSLTSSGAEHREDLSRQRTAEISLTFPPSENTLERKTVSASQGTYFPGGDRFTSAAADVPPLPRPVVPLSGSQAGGNTARWSAGSSSLAAGSIPPPAVHTPTPSTGVFNASTVPDTLTMQRGTSDGTSAGVGDGAGEKEGLRDSDDSGDGRGVGGDMDDISGPAVLGPSNGAVDTDMPLASLEFGNDDDDDELALSPPMSLGDASHGSESEGIGGGHSQLEEEGSADLGSGDDVEDGGGYAPMTQSLRQPDDDESSGDAASSHSEDDGDLLAADEPPTAPLQTAVGAASGGNETYVDTQPTLGVPSQDPGRDVPPSEMFSATCTPDIRVLEETQQTQAVSQAASQPFENQFSKVSPAKALLGAQYAASRRRRSNADQDPPSPQVSPTLTLPAGEHDDASPVIPEVLSQEATLVDPAQTLGSAGNEDQSLGDQPFRRKNANRADAADTPAVTLSNYDDLSSGEDSGSEESEELQLDRATLESMGYTPDMLGTPSESEEDDALDGKVTVFRPPTIWKRSPSNSDKRQQELRYSPGGNSPFLEQAVREQRSAPPAGHLQRGDSLDADMDDPEDLSQSSDKSKDHQRSNSGSREDGSVWLTAAPTSGINGVLSSPNRKSTGSLARRKRNLGSPSKPARGVEDDPIDLAQSQTPVPISLDSSKSFVLEKQDESGTAPTESPGGWMPARNGKDLRAQKKKKLRGNRSGAAGRRKTDEGPTYTTTRASSFLDAANVEQAVSSGSWKDDAARKQRAASATASKAKTARPRKLSVQKEKAHAEEPATQEVNSDDDMYDSTDSTQPKKKPLDLEQPRGSSRKRSLEKQRDTAAKSEIAKDKPARKRAKVDHEEKVKRESTDAMPPPRRRPRRGDASVDPEKLAGTSLSAQMRALEETQRAKQKEKNRLERERVAKGGSGAHPQDNSNSQAPPANVSPKMQDSAKNAATNKKSPVPKSKAVSAKKGSSPAHSRTAAKSSPKKAISAVAQASTTAPAKKGSSPAQSRTAAKSSPKKAISAVAQASTTTSAKITGANGEAQVRSPIAQRISRRGIRGGDAAEQKSFTKQMREAEEEARAAQKAKNRADKAARVLAAKVAELESAPGSPTPAEEAADTITVEDNTFSKDAKTERDPLITETKPKSRSRQMREAEEAARAAQKARNLKNKAAAAGKSLVAEAPLSTARGSNQVEAFGRDATNPVQGSGRRKKNEGGNGDTASDLKTRASQSGGEDKATKMSAQALASARPKKSASRKKKAPQNLFRGMSFLCTNVSDPIQKVILRQKGTILGDDSFDLTNAQPVIAMELRKAMWEPGRVASAAGTPKVVCLAPQEQDSSKYLFAQLAHIPCVRATWIAECIEEGALVWPPSDANQLPGSKNVRRKQQITFAKQKERLFEGLKIELCFETYEWKHTWTHLLKLGGATIRARIFDARLTEDSLDLLLTENPVLTSEYVEQLARHGAVSSQHASQAQTQASQPQTEASQGHTQASQESSGSGSKELTPKSRRRKRELADLGYSAGDAAFVVPVQQTSWAKKAIRKGKLPAFKDVEEVIVSDDEEQQQQQQQQQ